MLTSTLAGAVDEGFGAVEVFDVYAKGVGDGADEVGDVVVGDLVDLHAQGVAYDALGHRRQGGVVGRRGLAQGLASGEDARHDGAGVGAVVEPQAAGHAGGRLGLRPRGGLRRLLHHDVTSSRASHASSFSCACTQQ